MALGKLAEGEELGSNLLHGSVTNVTARMGSSRPHKSF